MEIFEWTEDIPVTANNLNEMQNRLIGGLSPLETYVNYSTDEQVIGAWINGEPVYRKVIVVPNSAFGTGTASSGTDVMYAHGISNLDLVTKINAFWEDTTYGRRRIRHLPISFFNNPSGWAMQVIPDSTSLDFEVGKDALNRIRTNGLDVYVIMEYTKISI